MCFLPSRYYPTHDILEVGGQWASAQYPSDKYDDAEDVNSATLSPRFDGNPVVYILHYILRGSQGA